VEKRKLTLLISIFLLTALASALYLGRFWQRSVLGIESEEKYLLLKNSPVNPLNIEQTINLGGQRQLAYVYHLFHSLSGLAIIDYDNNFLEWLPEAQIVPTTPPSRREAPGDHLQWLRFDDLDDTYGARELLVQYTNPGTAGVHPFYLYSYDGNNFKLLLKLVEASNKIEVRDLDDKWPKEIVHEYSLSGGGNLERSLLRWKDIWRVERGKPVKVNYQFPREYQELVDFYQLALTKKEWEPDVRSFYPVLHCLKEKAGLTIQGRPTDIEDCRELLRERYE